MQHVMLVAVIQFGNQELETETLQQYGDAVHPRDEIGFRLVEVDGRGTLREGVIVIVDAGRTVFPGLIEIHDGTVTKWNIQP